MTHDRLSPFFKYFGSKNKFAKFYPTPKYGKIIESHCGSAGYACNYPELDVLLCDVDPRVTAIWTYLIKSKPTDILALPLLDPGQSIDSLHICEEARLFLSCCINTSPFRKSLTSWKNGQNASLWGTLWREKVARQVAAISHWRVVNSSYHDLRNERATWFVDPIYDGMARNYSSRLPRADYRHLADWCRSRDGQVIVCERATATWLPFAPLGASAVQGGMLSRQHRGTCSEGVWIAENDSDSDFDMSQQ